MKKNKACRVMSKNKVSYIMRLLVTKRVFKVEKNGMFQARLVAQGYAQIPGTCYVNKYLIYIYR